MLRRIVVLAAAALAFSGGALGLVRAQAGDDLTAMTNADRTAAGIRALATASDLQSFAQSRANEMARTGRLAHTTNLGSKVSGWRKLGENVGRGPNLRDIETAFMASPSHRENILDPDFSQIGVGVTWDGKDYFYVAVLFRQPAASAAAASPPPAQPAPTSPPTTRATAPKPRPTTTTRPPATTTTQAPTTTTTVPPPPPVEAVVRPAEPPPPPPETTTTTAPRPVFTRPDFLAANFADRIVPAVATTPLPAPGRPAAPIVLAAFLGLAVGTACTATAIRRPDQLPEFSRRRHWR